MAMNTTTGATSGERIDAPQWDRIARSAQFQDLLRQKKLFIIPAFLFFLTYYLSLPVLLAYAPRFMSTRIFGTVTLAYLYALSQFIVGWTIAVLYMKISLHFDRLVEDLLKDEANSRIPSPGLIQEHKLAPEDKLQGGN